ncbi:HDOD domain-containing protein [Aureliella helgolandensis]|uniref:HDOD domain protein n=1 Tax=Aureliella helgolandensis TaxID=2527968 RepID=A0A518G8D1_9BACT|nr:HDOD domain-containing protein [Aureliella helgolandensis]QDV24845.1 HDOD domain protein [Aureliella helgolandensis]
MNTPSTIPICTPELAPVVVTTLAKVRSIATLPSIAAEIIQLVNDPHSNVEQIKRVVESDPALGTRILKLANSSFYGVPRKVDSLERAVVMLGLNAVKNTAIAASLHKVFQSPKTDLAFDPSQLWIHSIAAATIARSLAKMTRAAEPDVAFLTGLIHDVGVMVELQVFRLKFIDVIRQLDSNAQLSFQTAEVANFGATHAAFGAGLCRQWKFPYHMEQAIEFHHEPLQVPPEQRGLTTIVHVADILAANLKAGFTRTVDETNLSPEVLDCLGLSQHALGELQKQLPADIAEATALLAG